MAVKSVDRIITAKDYGGSMRGYLKKQQRELLRKRGIAVTIVDLDKPATGKPVYPRIWQSQWIADCDVCNAAMFVDPDEPIFFCFGCVNRLNGGKPRPVIFPSVGERKEIERLLLERPVDDLAGRSDLERVGMQKPLLQVQVEEVDESLVLQDVLLKDSKEKRSDAKMPTRTVMKPLVRSWEGESVEQLRAEQEEAIKNWNKELTRGVQ